ncbi:UNVERIFIED_ORG: hypothetical protein ABIB19_003800 [Arthrobacter sp. UYEF10]
MTLTPGSAIFLARRKSLGQTGCQPATQFRGHLGVFGQRDPRVSQQSQLDGKSQPVRVSATLADQRHIRITERVTGCKVLCPSGHGQDLVALGRRE